MASAANVKTVRRKIRSVKNLKKITRAMEMVSGAKLRKVQGTLLAIRPYSDKLRELLQRLSARVGEGFEAPMLVPRKQVRKVAVVVFSADKGLAGSYNSNVLRLAERKLRELKVPYDLYTVGKKAFRHFRRRGIEPVGHWEALPPTVGIREVREITTKVIGSFRRHEVDEVHLVYTEFVNPVRQIPTAAQFLPFDPKALIAEASAKKGEKGDKGGESEKKDGPALEFIFEPDPKTILEQLIPRYIEVRFFRTLLETLASEHSARMTAMRNATDNADELVKTLTLTYNKARQAAITKEILDIVGGAEALRG